MAETEKIIAEIIAHNMGMDYLDSRVVTPSSSNFMVIYNQDFVIPNTAGLYGDVEFSNSKMIATQNRCISTDNGILEIQECLIRETLIINLFSRNSDSRQRKHEVVLALNSVFCEQMQEKYNMRIFPISNSFVNTSKAEGGSMLNRYSITIYVQRKYCKTIADNAYYNRFEIKGYSDTNNEVNPIFDIIIE